MSWPCERANAHSKTRYIAVALIACLLSVLLPLFWSIVLWASNGKFHVKFIDSLFICVSAATGTGLATVDLSALTAWQQSILVILEILGSPVMVSWVVVMTRR